MTRVQSVIGERKQLAPFFSGHEDNGAPLRRSRSSHLAFAFEPRSQHLLIFAPHTLERRSPTDWEREHLRTLGVALEGFRELRAGNAGRLTLAPSVISAAQETPIYGASRVWESVTPYVVTRHVKGVGAAAAVAIDARAECRRLRLPDPKVESLSVRGMPRLGLTADVRLTFGQSVLGPIVLGRTRYFGGGLFHPVHDEGSR